MYDSQKHKDMQIYMEQKYGTDYMSAMLKLNVQNPFDEHGILKNEYALTEKEREAMKMYTGYREKSPIPVVQGIQESDPSYKSFLEDVQKYTLQQVMNCNSNDNKDVNWEIVGVEFRKDEVEKQYGTEVYEKASSEVPGMVVEGRNMHERDFSEAPRKLGCLIHEGVSASGIMDLGQFIELLAQKGIPSYIDFETNTYHYNATKKEKGL